MTIRTVGPNSDFPTIAASMLSSGPGDTIQLEAGYSNETATVLFSGMTIFGDAGSQGIFLNLALGIATVTLTGTAPHRSSCMTQAIATASLETRATTRLR